ncbi:MAG TPA: type I methionyl aminopeptidase [Candidatus Saccharimonadales bacterium]|nr:type I methionyl aminopeptidase [Candidatus Saccharimonadales bacterium]
MIHIKNHKEVEIMKRGGHMLAEVLFEVMKHAKPGVSEIELDALADRLIHEKGGEPGFKRVPGWVHATCMSTNDAIVHGIPTDYKLKEGDIIGVDCGVYLEGFHTDMSQSIIVGASDGYKDEKKETFISVGYQALEEAIKQVKPGAHIGMISKTIQMIVEGGGYSVVRNLIGHGVGKELHEAPEIPGYLTKPIEKTPILKEGMTIAVEVIYNMGKKEMVYDEDGWTIRTKDGSLSGLFERSVVVTRTGHEILTK